MSDKQLNDCLIVLDKIIFYDTIKHIFNRLMEKAMQKTYKLENLDCAQCAAKLESAFNEIEGVIKATVNFMTEKLVLEMEDEKVDTVLKEVEKVKNKIEPDCDIIF